MKILSKDKIEEAIKAIDGWKYNGKSIYKTYTFNDFIEATGFMAKVALLSEKMNHHPDWSGVYNIINIHLNTHDACGITEKDIQLAKLIENYSS